MKFSSIKEYFYKLYNVCYLITLVPLALFIYLYMKMQIGEINSLVKGTENMLIVQVALFSLVLFSLTTVHLVVKKKIKLLARELSLGNRMDRYFYLSLTRMGGGAIGSTLMGAGLFLTGSEIFSAFFLAILLWMAFHFPTPKKMCVELALKGDEREMVLYKRESL